MSGTEDTASPSLGLVHGVGQRIFEHIRDQAAAGKAPRLSKSLKAWELLGSVCFVVVSFLAVDLKGKPTRIYPILGLFSDTPISLSFCHALTLYPSCRKWDTAGEQMRKLSKSCVMSGFSGHRRWGHMLRKRDMRCFV